VGNHNRQQLGRYVRLAIATTVTIFLLYKLQRTVRLMLISLFLAAAIAPLVDQMQKYRISRLWSVVIIYAVILVMAIVTIAPAPQLINEMGVFLTRLPELLQKIELPKFPLVGGDAQRIINLLEQPLSEQFSELGKNLAGQTVDLTFRLLNALAIAVMSLAIAAYMAINAESLFKRILAPFKPDLRAQIYDLIPPISRCVSAYVIGKIGTSALLGFCTYLVISFLDIQFAGSLGLLAAVLNLIPFFGPSITLVAMMIVCWGAGLGKVTIVVGTSFLMQQTEAFILQPWLVGPYLNLNPFELLLSIIVGIELFGVVGTLIAPPIAGISRIIFDHIYQRRYLQPNLAGATIDPESDFEPDLNPDTDPKPGNDPNPGINSPHSRHNHNLDIQPNRHSRLKSKPNSSPESQHLHQSDHHSKPSDREQIQQSERSDQSDFSDQDASGNIGNMSKNIDKNMGADDRKID
jgi:predicted PurR-regulated permease PerM